MAVCQTKAKGTQESNLQSCVVVRQVANQLANRTSSYELHKPGSNPDLFSAFTPYLSYTNLDLLTRVKCLM